MICLVILFSNQMFSFQNFKPIVCAQLFFDIKKKTKKERVPSESINYLIFHKRKVISQNGSKILQLLNFSTKWKKSAVKNAKQYVPAITIFKVNSHSQQRLIFFDSGSDRHFNLVAQILCRLICCLNIGQLLLNIGRLKTKKEIQNRKNVRNRPVQHSKIVWSWREQFLSNGNINR